MLVSLSLTTALTGRLSILANGPSLTRSRNPSFISRPTKLPSGLRTRTKNSSYPTTFERHSLPMPVKTALPRASPPAGIR